MIALMLFALFLAQAAPTPTPITTPYLAAVTFATTIVALLITKLYEAWIKSKEHNKELKAKQLEIEAEQKSKALEAEIVRLAKEQEWRRQDEVAKRVQETANQAAEAAKLLLERQQVDSLKTAEAARLLLASNERVAANSSVVSAKLEVIHTWVNAKMTEAMQNELDSKEQALALLREILDLKQAAGRAPSDETIGQIKAMTERIVELKARLHERLKQQAVIDAKPASKNP